MGDLEGKTFVVTGANTGIGRVTATEIGKRGGRVILATRSREKTQAALDDIGDRAEWIELDLGDLASVRESAKELSARTERIDVLVANAGVAGHRGLTKQGFELTFGTNHLGHFLFTKLLLPRLEAAPSPRVVVVSSKAHFHAKGIDWAALREPTRTITGVREYEISKVCNVWFVRELAKRTKARTYAVHPGLIASDIWRRIPWPVRPLMMLRMRTTEQGAVSSLHCALSEQAGEETGLYYDADGTVKEPSDLAKDDALAKELWSKSEEWTQAFAD